MRPKQASTCLQAIHATAWVMGELPPAARQTFQQHLAHCPNCAAEVLAHQQTLARLRAARLPDAEPAAGLTDRIMAALPPDAFHSTPFTRTLSFVRRHRLPLAAAAAAMLVFSLILRLVSPQPNTTNMAATAGCAWIARQQEPDGAWDPVKNGGAERYRTALTALASLALMREPGLYSRQIDAACTAMLRQQQPDGSFGTPDSSRMYNHALATWALLTNYNRKPSPALRDALDKALTFIRNRQQFSGGWGYLASADDPANTAVTAWQVQVLARAQQAGWSDDGGHLRKGLSWLRQRLNAAGQFDYTASHEAQAETPTLNAMGAYTLLTAGNSSPELVQAAKSAIDHLRAATSPNVPAPGIDFYQAFFTVAAWDAAGERTNAARLRSGLCGQRERQGRETGSWAPADSWGKVGGRLYATSLSVLMLKPQDRKKL